LFATFTDFRLDFAGVLGQEIAELAGGSLSRQRSLRVRGKHFSNEWMQVLSARYGCFALTFSTSIYNHLGRISQAIKPVKSKRRMSQ
jgi:hypothetical protein